MGKSGVRSYQNIPLKFIELSKKTEYQLLQTGFIRKSTENTYIRSFYKLSRDLCFSYGKPEPVFGTGQNRYYKSQQSIYDKLL